MPFGTFWLNDGNKIPAIAYGTGSVWKGHDVKDYVQQAIDAGFWHIDTAAYYGNEGSVGDAIRESGLKREELYVTTKYGDPLPGNVLTQVQLSLSKLGLKSVDLYLVHSVPVDVEGTWKAMERIQEEGFARSIGVSNYGVAELEKTLKVATVKPAVNQIQFHPYNYAQQKPILEFCAKHGIIVEAYSSLVPITRYPGGPVDKPVAAAAKRRGVEPGQIILLWVKSKGIVIVTTSSKKERLEEYLAVHDLEPLTDEEIQAIESAGARGPGSVAARGAKILVWLALLGFLWYIHSQDWQPLRHHCNGSKLA